MVGCIIIHRPHQHCLLGLHLLHSWFRRYYSEDDTSVSILSSDVIGGIRICVCLPQLLAANWFRAVLSLWHLSLIHLSRKVSGNHCRDILCMSDLTLPLSFGRCARSSIDTISGDCVGSLDYDCSGILLVWSCVTQSFLPCCGGVNLGGVFHLCGGFHGRICVLSSRQSLVVPNGCYWMCRQSILLCLHGHCWCANVYQALERT